MRKTALTSDHSTTITILLSKLKKWLHYGLCHWRELVCAVWLTCTQTYRQTASQKWAYPTKKQYLNVFSLSVAQLGYSHAYLPCSNLQSLDTKFAHHYSDKENDDFVQHLNISISLCQVQAVMHWQYSSLTSKVLSSCTSHDDKAI